MAWLAGGAGCLDLAFSVGMPLVRYLRHQPVTPAFFFFGLWGLIALYGCAACIYTYYTSGDGPGKPPHGGLPERAFTVLEGGRAAERTTRESNRAA